MPDTQRATPDLHVTISQLGDNELRALAWSARYMLTRKQQGEPPPLRELIPQLDEAQRGVLALLADRLLIGFREYGPLPLKKGGRDWRHERRLEMEDAVNYSSFDGLISGCRTRRSRVHTANILDVAIADIRMGLKKPGPKKAAPPHEGKPAL